MHPRVSFRHLLASGALLAIAAATLGGCEGGDDERSRDHEREPTGEISSELVSYNCGISKSTGYLQGNPFEVTLVTVDGYPVEINLANAFLTMAKAAEGAGLNMRLNSGFRTPQEQQYLYNCYKTCSCNSCNEAAAPGWSNHQSGHALDINVSGGVLAWLNANAGAFGFKRTVASETWHWEWWGGGNPQPYCSVCGDGCIGNVLSRSNCQTTDCGAMGATCKNDAGGLRCECPTGCLGNTLSRANCEKTDCGSQAAVCRNDGAGLRCDALPRGSLDRVDDSGVSGWAQDPSKPDQAIEAHVYFGGPAGDPKAVGVNVAANRSRDDLCKVLGSCAHAFAMGAPRSLLDDAPHAVYAYGIDASGGDNALLGNSPRTLRAPTPGIPASAVLRRVPNATAFAAWKFSLFLDVAPAPDGEAKLSTWRNQIGAPLTTAPTLVRSADGTDGVWLIDGGLRRRVTDTEAWRLSGVTIDSLGASELFQLPRGADLPERPLLIGDAGPTYYLLDVPYVPMTGAAGPDDDYPDTDTEPQLPGAPPSAGGTSAVGSGEGVTVPTESTTEAGCAVGGGASGSPAGVPAVAGLLVGLGLALGRRRPRSGSASSAGARTIRPGV
jgi:hypothetical protein